MAGFFGTFFAAAAARIPLPPPSTTALTDPGHEQPLCAAAPPSCRLHFFAAAASPHRRRAADLVCGGGSAAAIAPLQPSRRPPHVGCGGWVGFHSIRSAAAVAQPHPSPRRGPHQRPPNCDDGADVVSQELPTRFFQF